MERFTTKIKGFPEDDLRWRVDFFGEFDLNDNVPSAPSVDVLLSPLHENRISSAKLHSNQAVNLSRQKRVAINCGYLPFVRMGSVWRNAARDDSVPIDSFQKETFRGLNIRRDNTCRVLRADTTLDTNKTNYLLPHSVYRLGYYGLRTRFLTIDYKGVPNRILIPTVEVGRFWYFNSSSLTQKLVRGLMEDHCNEIYRPDLSGYGSDGTTATIWLREGIPYTDRAVVARLALTEKARDRTRQIHRTLQIARINKSPMSPDIFPPYEGSTDLTVFGKWFRSKDESRFLVFWISSCSHPMPWEELIWDSDHPPTGRPENSEFNETHTGEFKRKRIANESERTRTLRSDAEPNKAMLPTTSLLNEERFTDLKNKPIQRLRSPKDRPIAVRLPTYDNNFPDEGFSSGDGRWVSDVKPISVQVTENDHGNEPNRRPACPAGLTEMCSVLAFLTTLGDIAVAYRESENSEAATGTMIFPGNSKWCFINGRRRQVLVAEITHRSDNYFYLFEIERRIENQLYRDRPTTLLAWTESFQVLDQTTIDSILRVGANNRGVWPNGKVLPHILGEKFKHTWPTHAEFAARLIGQMNSLRDVQTPPIKGAVRKPPGENISE